MGALIWIGGAMVAIGLVGLVWCILSAMALKRAAPPEDVARTRMHLLVAVNMGSVALSFLGLGVMAASLLL